MIYRIIDANINRALEATRVLEDIGRFYLNNVSICTTAKNIRHSLSLATSQLPCVPHRDTAHDIGTSIQGTHESTRQGTHGLVKANARRLSEALRTIEESLKTTSNANIAQKIEQLRYQSYQLEKALLDALPCPPSQWPLCVLLTIESCTNPWQNTLKDMLEAGLPCLQIREKTLNDTDLLKHIDEALAICSNYNCATILNDRIDLALIAGVHGVHFGQQDLTVKQARKLAGNQLWIGKSTHSSADIDKAVADGADYIGVGPMFKSQTKDKGFTLTTDVMSHIHSNYPNLPYLAIGGIDMQTLPLLKNVECKGIAISQAVCAHNTPGVFVKDILAQL